MQEMLRVAIVMEMLFVNLFTVHICANHKYSVGKTAAALLAFTIVLTAFTHQLWQYMEFEIGNALFASIGIVYLIPLRFLYREGLRRVMSILFSAWVYTLIVYCLAVRFAYLWPQGLLVPKVLFIQSVLYLLTLYPFLIWIRKGFLFILRHVTQGCRYLLQLVSLGWFITIVIINAALLDSSNQPFNLFAITAIAVNSFLSYLLIYSMAASHFEVKNLEDIVYVDPLTGSLNRTKLFHDAKEMITAHTPFRLVFIDLNRFKSINDRYGHMTGDRYLIAFVKTTGAFLGPSDRLYRMSGDEFVILSQARSHEPLMDALQRYPAQLDGMDVPFLGCSVGAADYPAEGMSLDKLISLADSRMYEQKACCLT